MITFTHRKGRLLDQDLAPRRSKMVANVGAWNEYTAIFDTYEEFRLKQDETVVDPSQPGVDALQELRGKWTAPEADQRQLNDMTHGVRLFDEERNDHA